MSKKGSLNGSKMISRNSRPYKLGYSLGENLCEVANVFYLLDNGEQFLTGIKEVIEPKLKEIENMRRKKKQERSSRVGKRQ